MLSKQFFSSTPNLLALGVELDEAAYQRALVNIAMFTKLTNVHILQDDSTTFVNWEPATIVMQYDGPPTNHLQEYHLTIMRAIFRTPTVKCVFSTKLNLNLFIDYFTREEERVVKLRDWRLVKITGLNFGGSSYTGNLWIRILTSEFQGRTPDRRIQKLLEVIQEQSAV